jgi:DnaJ family protein C protein 28
MVDKFARSIDEQIRKAMQEGSFDNLPGKGKPFDLEINPFEAEDWSMAYRMLRSSGYTLPWIETRRIIEEELDTARFALDRSWQWRCENQLHPRGSDFADREWQRALAVFKEKIVKLNERIYNYNLQVPSNQFMRYKIDLEWEISQITDQSN